MSEPTTEAIAAALAFSDASRPYDPEKMGDACNILEQLRLNNESYDEAAARILATAYRSNLMSDADSDSVVGSCNCLTKTNEVRFHKSGCKYRLISERDDLLARLADANRALQFSESARKEWADKAISNPARAGAVETECEDLRRTVKELQRDRARLDWLEENSVFSGGGNGGQFSFRTPKDTECSREAISAAMTLTPLQSPCE
jgi:hypothetical protein